MRTDAYGLIVLEGVGAPGNSGDSCAETFRCILLLNFLGDSPDIADVQKAVASTRTNLGYLRHPESPWRENTFSGDQWLPRFLAVDKVEAAWMLIRLNLDGYRTGNGDPIGPMLYAAIKRRFGTSRWLDVSLWIQAMLFKLPWRWSDEKNWFETNKDSSADYLNWFMYLLFCEMQGHSYWSRKAKQAMNPDVLRAKVQDYYKPEPNAFVVELYDQVISRVWGI